ncbi:hypothetical protein B0H12DRAFT_1076017 [Mycena haematopus]|nr:hypothetical protein B0H12DRAFT_1076017 [Mycena haematopus]
MLDNAKWLAKGVPIPSYLKEECPHYGVHTFELTLGAQERTADQIGVHTRRCTVKKCPRIASRMLPPAARTELREMLNAYKAITKRFNDSTSASETSAVRKELRQLEARRDNFAKRDWSESPDSTTPPPKRPAEWDDEDAARSRKKKRESDVKEQDEDSVGVQTQGKGKAVDRHFALKLPTGGEDVQYDDHFDADTYVLDSCQSLSIDVIVYDVADAPPKEESLQLRHGGGLNLADTTLAARVRGITTPAGRAYDYDWYDVFGKDFLPGAFTTTINMIPRGRFLVCRRAAILNSECPDLQDWIDLAYRSLVPLAAAYSSDEADDAVEFVRVSSSQSSRPQGPSQSSTVAGSSQSSAVAGSSRTSQSSPSRISTAASTKRPHKVSEADGFEAMDKEDAFWLRQDEEHKVLIRRIKTTAETAEVIEISDSDE